jgi:hypothetical protein
MFFFSGPVGRVVRLDDRAAPGGLRLLEMKSAPITYDLQRSIITRLSVDVSVSAQFMHMLGGEIYIHVFGDRIGTLQLSGLSFAHACETPGDNQPGIEKMLLWYRQNKLTKRFSPLRVVVGETPFDAFLTNFIAGAQDPATGLTEWTTQLTTLPDEAV